MPRTMLLRLALAMSAFAASEASCANEDQQCGGQGFTPVACCYSYHTCQVDNEYYHACRALPPPCVRLVRTPADGPILAPLLS